MTHHGRLPPNPPTLGWRATVLIWLATGILLGALAESIRGAPLSDPRTWLASLLVGAALAAGALAGRALPKIARRLFS